jgi:hypothetical protein
MPKHCFCVHISYVAVSCVRPQIQKYCYSMCALCCFGFLTYIDIKALLLCVCYVCCRGLRVSIDTKALLLHGCYICCSGLRVSIDTKALLLYGCFFFNLHSWGWSPNWVHSARRPFTGLLYLYSMGVTYVAVACVCL